jgi:type I restriction enzyme R subunit
MEKLERAIDRYNEGCANFASDPQLVNPQEKITRLSSSEARRDKWLDIYDGALVELTDDVAKEEQRSTQEGLSEEELAIFDLLATDAPLSKDDHVQVKKVARDLLAALRPTFNVIDWQKKPVTLGRAYGIIEDELFKLPQPTYRQEVSEQKCGMMFLYVQERYKNDGTTSVA